jgi:hypothetical protein
VEQSRDAIPGHVRVVACILRCQSIKCPYMGAGVWAMCVQVPSTEAILAEGALSPRAGGRTEKHYVIQDWLVTSLLQT